MSVTDASACLLRGHLRFQKRMASTVALWAPMEREKDKPTMPRILLLFILVLDVLVLTLVLLQLLLSLLSLP